MTFELSRDRYDRYMGRYSDTLAPGLMSFVGIRPGMRALDVGCGPGALTEALTDVLDPAKIAAADPSDQLLAACAERVPAADVRQATADDLPWPDARFDVVLSQLVMNFLPDPDAGLGEMSRVAVPGGVVASCTWDYAGGMQMLRTFWDAALNLDPSAPDEGREMALCSQEELADLWSRHGLVDVETGSIDVTVDYEDFDDFWEPFTLGVGPGGAYCASLDSERQQDLRLECFRWLDYPEGPFSLTARAFAVRGYTT
jgi:SAM-dependent methyltransferase